MARRLAELCTLLVQNAYGDLAAQIFSTLAEYGRLPLFSLRQLFGIPLRRLRAGLTTLIQHHIVLYHSEHEFAPTYFSIDWDAAYVLVRLQKLIRTVKDREGEAAGQIISNILQLGHANIGDLADEYDLNPGSKRDSGIDTVEDHVTEHGLINGIAKKAKQGNIGGATTSIAHFHATLRNLLAKGYLIKVNERTRVPLADLNERIRETVISEHFPDKKITGPKKAKLYQKEVNVLKRKWREEDNYSEYRDVASHGEIRRYDSSISVNKRVKTDHLRNGITHDDHHTDEHRSTHDDASVKKLPSDLVVRVNFAKCTILLRNQRLEQTAQRFLGSTTAGVYKALLRALESKIKTVRRPSEDEYSDASDFEEDVTITLSATDTEVYEHLDPALELGSKFKCVKPTSRLPNGKHKHRNKTRVVIDDDDDAAGLGIKQETHSDSEVEMDTNVDHALKERNKRMQLIDTHLNILAEHPKRFCIRTANSSKSRVDFSALSKMLIGLELETMINARFGRIPTRLIRILREKGKVDAQQLANMTMTLHNDLCTQLTSLQFAGLAQSQELPKDATHQTSRAVHLWWFDEKSVTSQYLERTYQGMARILQRLQHERETKFKAVIDKAERVDVKGRENELLNQQDKEEIKKWQEMEEQLRVQLSRLDDVVAVLRDFDGEDTTLMT